MVGTRQKTVNANHAIHNFITRLYMTRSSPENLYFNPWASFDPCYDASPSAPVMRCENLYHFLQERNSFAEFVLLGESLRFQEGKFSGIAMISESILGGAAVPRFPRKNYHPRTSKASSPQYNEVTKQCGFNDRSASAIWSGIISNEINPFSVVTWHLFPFHPHHWKDTLSNRVPTYKEIEQHSLLLIEFLKLFPKAKLISVGQRVFDHLGGNVPLLRHPLSTGAIHVRESIRSFILGEE